jgi:hypothetical protein
MQDAPKSEIRVIQNVAVRQADDCVTTTLQPFRPLEVVEGTPAISMLATIQLNDQFRLRAIEINNVWADRLLTPEFEAG